MAASRRAISIAAVVSVLVLAIAGSVLSLSSSAGSETTRATAHQVVADHDAVVAARPLADRASFDLRSDQSKLLLLAWVGLLLVAAVLARTTGRTLEVHARRADTRSWTRHAFDRGPPVLLSV